VLVLVDVFETVNFIEVALRAEKLTIGGKPQLRCFHVTLGMLFRDFLSCPKVDLIRCLTSVGTMRHNAVVLINTVSKLD
jgi:hypothetical protein